MDPYILFLSNGSSLTDSKESEKVRRMSAHFWLSKGKKLYQSSFRGPYLLCLHPNKVTELLAELHEGIFGGHSGRRSLAHRAITQGFWWLSMQQDAANDVKKCDQCQRHAPIIHQLDENLISVTSL